MNMKFNLLSERMGSIADEIAAVASSVKKVLGAGECLGILANFNASLMKNGFSKNNITTFVA